jgi:hypothetical protein
MLPPRQEVWHVSGVRQLRMVEDVVVSGSWVSIPFSSTAWKAD